jgi:hypothetical protein
LVIMAIRKMTTSRITDSRWYKNVSGSDIGYVPIVYPTAIDFLVIAGGGAGGGDQNYYMNTGGGGAGGYRTSVGTTGGGGTTETALTRTLTSYTITVGAGGAGAYNGSGTQGSSSVFGTITTVGGGYGAAGNNVPGGAGGSGGGGGNYYSLSPAGGAGTANQGFRAENGNGQAGGGAGGVSVDWNTPGIGIASTITGTSVNRAGGGKGSPSGNERTGKTIWGGGGNNYNDKTGTANTGSGGGAKSNSQENSGNGGSGVVILRYSATSSPLVVGAGLTYTDSIVGSNRVYVFTAGTGTITW